MLISFPCPCGKLLRVNEDWAGRRVNCTVCGRSLLVPATLKPSAPSPELAAPVAAPQPAIEEQSVQHPPVPRSDSFKHLLSAGATARHLRHYGYFLLLVALAPLAFSQLRGKEDSFNERLARTIDKAPSDVRQRIDRVITAIQQGTTEEEELFSVLPDGRIEGALLPRKTFVHFLYAFLTAGVFCYLATFLIPGKTARLSPVVLAGLFTATFGILFLFLVRQVGDLTQNVVVYGGNVFVVAIYWTAAAIAYSYRAALDPHTGFLASFLGFSVGVGLCEEVCKALPLIWYYRRDEGTDWREACAIGFGSGVGFGAAEAVVYAGTYYNGVYPMSMYVVRFCLLRGPARDLDRLRRAVHAQAPGGRPGGDRLVRIYPGGRHSRGRPDRAARVVRHGVEEGPEYVFALATALVASPGSALVRRAGPVRQPAQGLFCYT